MNPREFNILAAKLAKGAGEAEIRSAISRAYYAVYNVGVDLLSNWGFRIYQNPQGHAQVQHRLSNCGDLEIMKVGSRLSDLSSERIKADYRLQNKKIENSRTAEAIVKNAERLIMILDANIPELRRSEIIENIKAWEEKTSQKTFSPS